MGRTPCCDMAKRHLLGILRLRLGRKLPQSRSGRQRDRIFCRTTELWKFKLTHYLPLERLALSPQCGFASTMEGNLLTEEEQWAKMRLVMETAHRVWG